jgi:anti-anti-sigma factor
VIAGNDTMPFRVSVVRSGDRAVVRLAGELDCASAPELERALAELLVDKRPTVVVVDATRLTFTDVVGAGLLIDTADRLAPSGKLVVRDAGRQVVRVFTLLERAELLW